MVLPFSCLLRLVSWLAETNRTPFNLQKENQNQFRDLILNTGRIYLLDLITEQGRIFFFIMNSLAFLGILLISLLIHIVFWFFLRLLSRATFPSISLWSSNKSPRQERCFCGVSQTFCTFPFCFLDDQILTKFNSSSRLKTFSN